MGEIQDVLLFGAPMAHIVEVLRATSRLHVLEEAADPDLIIQTVGPGVRAAVVTITGRLPATVMARLPKLEFVARFGVGYDCIDIQYAAGHGVTVTNTPDVLTEEVADSALGLLLCTVRQFPHAERYLRAGRWKQDDYPPSQATLRDRTVGIVGLGRIGKAIARRLDAFGVPVVYHSRRVQPDAVYRYYPTLVGMASDVDTLIVITPGGAGTRHLINAEVLAALGPRGILINMARGTVVDDAALMAAIESRTIHSAGLDVFTNEPDVPQAYLAMDHIVLLPHVGSATEYTRLRMQQLVVDNIEAWVAGEPPLTPVPETPWPPAARSGAGGGG